MLHSSVVASIGRIFSIPQLVATNVPATIHAPYLYAVVEPAFAIIAACLPTYRPIFTFFRRKICGSSAGSRGSSRGKLLGGGDRSGGSDSRASERARAQFAPARAMATLYSVEEAREWNQSSQESLPPPAVPPKDVPPVPMRMPQRTPGSPIPGRVSVFPPLRVVTTPGFVPPKKHVTHISR